MGIEIKIKHRKFKTKLNLTSKVTVIVGDSATGKSTIRRLSEFGDKSTIIKISDQNFKMMLIRGEFHFERLQYDNKLHTNMIYIIDEGKLKISDKLIKVIQNTIGSYFIITTRKELKDIDCDIKELKADKNGIIVLVNRQERIV